MNAMRKLTRSFLSGFVCLLLLGICANAAAAKQIEGYYEGDDGGAYFIRQIGDKIYWFAEDPHGAWANVLMGTITGNKINGKFWDVPKGKTQGTGEIVLEIQGDGASLVKVSSTTPFGTKIIKQVVPHNEVVNGIPVLKGFPPEMRSRPQGFSGGDQNLTGVWQGDDAAFYYVRQTPTDIVWVAENNQWGGEGGNARPSFVHVFFGKKINNLITGNWVDLPKGKAEKQGVLAARLTSSQEMLMNPSSDGIYSSELWRSLPNSLRGFADLHAHPMVNLGFGGKLIHGGVDIGSLLPADSKCQHNVRATSIGQALGPDNGTHGSPDFDNPCGDVFRRAVVFGYEEANDALVTVGKTSDGAPKFNDYPRWNDIAHQKMWVDWIRRSYDEGQRVMVALAVNNATLAAAVSGPGDGPTDDKGSADLQIAEIKSFVQRHNDFMEVAYAPADMRRIVGSNKMAIILGVEVDNIGNFNQFPNWNLTPAAVRIGLYHNEFARLYQQGVRYIFPIHVLDNRIGGTAVYEDFFNYSNKRETGHWWDFQCAPAEDNINYKFSPLIGDDVPDAAKDLLSTLAGMKMSLDLKAPKPKNCMHENNLGLDPEIGASVIKELMKLGIMVDVDHMSQKSVNETLDIAEKVPGGYPVVSGHTSLRGKGGNENSRTDKQLQRIGALGGMFGLGSAKVAAAEFLRNYDQASQTIGKGRVALGTDLNGLVKGVAPVVTIDIKKPVPPQLKACPSIYDDAFVRSKTGDRTWDYCTEGVAHYGMLADFLKHMFSMPQKSSDNSRVLGEAMQTDIMRNAEMFAEMWERAVKNSKAVQ